MGQIVSYLRSNGLLVDQDDLHIRLNHELRFGAAEDRIDPAVFFDEGRVLAYAAGGEDGGIDAVLEKVEARSRFAGYSVILLSLTADIRNPSGSLFVLALSRYLKRRHGPVIIVGGFERRETDALLRYNGAHIDYIGRGPGEKLLFLALAALKNGAGLGELPGRPLDIQGKEISSARPSFWIEPDYDGLPLSLYEFQKPRPAAHRDPELAALVSEFHRSRVLVSPHMLVEGCFHGCIFCSCSNTGRVLCLSPREAAAQLRRLRERFGVRNFFFLNRMINLSRRYVNDLCDELLRMRLDILWADCARADNLDRDTLKKMRAAGCVRLIYGLETGSPRLLERIEKRVKPEHLEDVLRWTDEAGILSGLEIICGFPGETPQDVGMTIDFIKRNRACLDMVYYNMLYVEKQSRLYLNPERYGVARFFEAQDAGPEFGNMQVGFDEAGGLGWKEKLAQTRASYERIMRETARPQVPYFEIEHFIFFLYSKFKDKKKIVAILEKVAGDPPVDCRA